MNDSRMVHDTFGGNKQVYDKIDLKFLMNSVLEKKRKRRCQSILLTFPQQHKWCLANLF